MPHGDLYTKVVLTVIAALLALNTPVRFDVPVAHAQAGQYSVVDIKTNWGHLLPSLETAVNDAAKGRELVTVVPFDQPGRYIAVYKQPSR
jgi:hypothetical protein